jgi:hypothetical protein
MANRMPYTKSLLFELTSEISQKKPAGEGIRSSEVVDEVMKNIKSIPDAERDEITRVGLRVLAGRVTSMGKSDASQLDIFEREKFPVFVGLRLRGEDGKFRTQRFDVKKLTPNLISQHTPMVPKNKSNSKRDNLIAWANQRIANGFGDVSVEFS